MQLRLYLFIPLFTILTNAQSIPFSGFDIEIPDIPDIPSVPDPPSFAASPGVINGRLSSGSFSSASSSVTDGEGGSTVSQISTTCIAGANCETHVNGIVNGTAVVGAPSPTLVTSTVRRIDPSASPTSRTSVSSQLQSEQSVAPVGNGGLLGGTADLTASGTAGSTVVVTGVPTATAKATKPEEASSDALREIDRKVFHSLRLTCACQGLINVAHREESCLWLLGL